MDRSHRAFRRCLMWTIRSSCSLVMIERHTTRALAARRVRRNWAVRITEETIDYSVQHVSDGIRAGSATMRAKNTRWSDNKPKTCCVCHARGHSPHSKTVDIAVYARRSIIVIRLVVRVLVRSSTGTDLRSVNFGTTIRTKASTTVATVEFVVSARA